MAKTLEQFRSQRLDEPSNKPTVPPHYTGVICQEWAMTIGNAVKPNPRVSRITFQSAKKKQAAEIDNDRHDQ